jgi:signal transduction histidine kinase
VKASRLTSSRLAVLPLGGLTALVLVVPVTPSRRDALELLIAGALVVVGAGGCLTDRPWRGMWAIATAATLAVVAVAHPVGQSTTSSWLPVAAGPLVAACAAAAIVGKTWPGWLALAGGILAGPLRMLLDDPFLDPTCTGCAHNPIVLAPHHDFAHVLLIVGTATAAAAVAAAATRSASWLLLGGALVVGASIRWPEARTAIAAIALFAVVADLRRAVVLQRRVESLVRALRTDADLEEMLRHRLGDPNLVVAHWLTGERRFVTRTGFDGPDRTDGQITTELRVGGTLVAQIHHDPRSAEVIALADAIDAPARIALENEGLSARLAAHARELQRSRQRIVERGDLERRQLERDVHDGAQQHVLALGFDLRTAINQTLPTDPRRAVLEHCLAETTSALDDLRDLSHGLYPPSLQAAGLASALQSLARRFEVNVTIDHVPSGRLQTPVERTLFALVADAAGSTEHDLAVDIERLGASVEARISGTKATPGQQVLDRIAALDGSLTATDHTIRVVIPCAS